MPQLVISCLILLSMVDFNYVPKFDILCLPIKEYTHGVKNTKDPSPNRVKVAIGPKCSTEILNKIL